MTRRNGLAQIRRLSRRFRILDGWNISLDRRSRYKGQTNINAAKRTAVIYDWPPGEAVPRDFYLHEVLHIVLRAGYGSGNLGRDEQVIRDLCRVFVESAGQP